MRRDLQRQSPGLEIRRCSLLAPEGCTVEFEDPDFVAEGRDALYYVRALEEPIATINGGNLRASFDKNGQAETTDMCYGDFRTSIDDDCQQPHNQRAWSSPIFVDYKK